MCTTTKSTNKSTTDIDDVCITTSKMVIKESNNCFDPRRSSANPNALAVFIRSPIIKDLNSVPGVGEGNKKLLKKDGIHTTHQLIGKFLSLSEEDTDCIELCDKFYFWLQSIGVNSHRGPIVSAIGEKTMILVPGVYDCDAYDE